MWSKTEKGSEAVCTEPYSSPIHRDFCTSMKEVKLEPKLEELILLNRETENVNAL